MTGIPAKTQVDCFDRFQTNSSSIYIYNICYNVDTQYTSLWISPTFLTRMSLSPCSKFYFEFWLPPLWFPSDVFHVCKQKPTLQALHCLHWTEAGCFEANRLSSLLWNIWGEIGVFRIFGQMCLNTMDWYAHFVAFIGLDRNSILSNEADWRNQLRLPLLLLLFSSPYTICLFQPCSLVYVRRLSSVVDNVCSSSISKGNIFIVRKSSQINWLLFKFVIQ